MRSIGTDLGTTNSIMKEANKVDQAKTNPKVIRLQLSDEFFEVLRSVSGNACRVLFGVLKQIHDGNRIDASQREIGRPVGLSRTSTCKALSELRERGLLFTLGKARYTVHSRYFLDRDRE